MIVWKNRPHGFSLPYLPRSAWRAVGFLGIWLALSGADPAGFPAGAFAVAAATWTSLILLPPDRLRVSPTAVAHLVLRFLCQSIMAGTDVARRALHPRLPLRPGFMGYRGQLAPGRARNTFRTLSSLLPGTLPVAADETGFLIHCLDLGQPVAAQLTEDEMLLMRAAGMDRHHG
jgi:multicomponent Na+:H+ antiporter subunit E